MILEPEIAAPPRFAREWTAGGGAGRDRARPAGRPRAGHRRGDRREPGNPAERGRGGAGVARRRRVSSSAAASPPASPGEEWCERRLLARVHRYTLDRLRREIEPVSQADFLRFLLAWQRVDPDGAGRGAGEPRRPARPARGVRGRRLRLGGGDPAGADEGVRPVVAGWPLPGRPLGLGAGSGAVVGRLPALRAGARDPHRAALAGGSPPLAGDRGSRRSGIPGALGGGAGGLRPAAEPRRLLLRRDRPRRGAAPHPVGDGARRAGRLGPRHLGQLHRPARPADARPQAPLGGPLGAARRRSLDVRHGERGSLVAAASHWRAAGGVPFPRRRRDGRLDAAAPLRRGLPQAAGEGDDAPPLAGAAPGLPASGGAGGDPRRAFRGRLLGRAVRA